MVNITEDMGDQRKGQLAEPADGVPGTPPGSLRYMLGNARMPFGPMRRLSPDSGVTMFAMGLAQVPLVLGMADELQMLRIPAGVDAAPMV